MNCSPVKIMVGTTLENVPVPATVANVRRTAIGQSADIRSEHHVDSGEFAGLNAGDDRHFMALMLIVQPTTDVFNTDALKAVIYAVSEQIDRNANGYQPTSVRSCRWPVICPATMNLVRTWDFSGTGLGSNVNLEGKLQAAPAISDSGFESPSVTGSPNGYEDDPLGNRMDISTPPNTGIDSGIVGNDSQLILPTTEIAAAPEGVQAAYLFWDPVRSPSRFPTGRYWPANTRSDEFRLPRRPGFRRITSQVLIDGTVVATIDPTSSTYPGLHNARVYRGRRAHTRLEISGHRQPLHIPR